jgi:hypothetical protein
MRRTHSNANAKYNIVELKIKKKKRSESGGEVWENIKRNVNEGVM